jgi:hypothetical protein
MSKLRSALSNAYSVARDSWGGRIVFVGHLLCMIVVVRHYEISFPSLPVLAFAIVDSPQFILLRFVPGIAGWSWALLGLFISIPWWGYGMAAEFAIRRLVSYKLSLSAKPADDQMISLKDTFCIGERACLYADDIAHSYDADNSLIVTGFDHRELSDVSPVHF